MQKRGEIFINERERKDRDALQKQNADFLNRLAFKRDADERERRKREMKMTPYTDPGPGLVRVAAFDATKEIKDRQNAAYDKMMKITGGRRTKRNKKSKSKKNKKTKSKKNKNTKRRRMKR
jgi:hypothetical protein